MKTVNNVSAAPEYRQGSFLSAVAVAPSDAAPLADASRGIYIGGGVLGAGNLAVIMAGDASNTPVVFTGVPVGTVLYIAASYVRATGTTATAIIALY